MKKLVLLLHGESICNKQARFTGWADVDLTPKGIKEATEAGRTLIKAGYVFDKDTIIRFLPYWHDTIAPAVKSGKRVLISAHGNSLRALVKYIDDIPNEQILGLNIPTGIPLVYELEDDLTAIRSYYIGDPDAIKQATQTVANQLKQKT